jgi:four helix bundle protein
MAHRFDVLQVALDLIHLMRPVVERIRQMDRQLANQLKAATSSIASNISEGSRRLGKDRIHLWSVAAGSADEVRTQLAVAVAWGDIEQPAVKPPLEHLDRILAMLWRLTHRRP